jgi:hypothetical protein
VIVCEPPLISANVKPNALGPDGGLENVNVVVVVTVYWKLLAVVKFNVVEPPLPTLENNSLKFVE